MRAIGILGSPRRYGNTGTLMDTTLARFTERGHSTEVYHLREMNISDCNGCLGCQKDLDEITDCVIKDDMQTLYTGIRNADAVLVGSPIYMHDLTGRTRNFISRLHAFFRPGHPYGLTPPKPSFLFVTHGQRMHEHYDRSLCLPVGAMAMAGLRFVDIFSVGRCPMGEPSIRAGMHEEALLKAAGIGDWFASALEGGMNEEDFYTFGPMDGLDIAASSGVIPSVKVQLNLERLREAFGDDVLAKLLSGEDIGGDQ